MVTCDQVQGLQGFSEHVRPMRCDSHPGRDIRSLAGCDQEPSAWEREEARFDLMDAYLRSVPGSPEARRLLNRLRSR